MKFLITGGVGFLGSHICEKYINEDKDNKVVCLDNFSNSNLFNIRALLNNKNFKLVNGDIRNKDLLEKLMPGVDVVIHLAAQIHVDKSIIDPIETYETNVLGTLNVLEAARTHDAKRILIASTSEVYGPAKYVPMDEAHPLESPHPYGASKIAADRMALAYNHTYNLGVDIIRCFNMYGPKQRDTGYGGAISIFTKRALNNQPPIIFGDGSQTRDYMYIKDGVKAYDLVLKHQNGSQDRIINFGTATEISILDLAKKIIKLSGKDFDPVFVSPRPGEVNRLYCNYDKAKNLYGFKPDYDLDTGLKEYIEWHKNHKAEEWVKG
ncbi:MAG: GDP-mannose 4,6-dehydratase [Nanoarchaeota archaeon]